MVTGLAANGYCVSGQPVIETLPRAVPSSGGGFANQSSSGGGGSGGAFNSTILGKSFGAASP